VPRLRVRPPVFRRSHPLGFLRWRRSRPTHIRAPARQPCRKLPHWRSWLRGSVTVPTMEVCPPRIRARTPPQEAAQESAQEFRLRVMAIT
jgi:hypothetical protein